MAHGRHLTPEQRAAIKRELLLNSTESLSAMARRLGVYRGTLSKIRFEMMQEGMKAVEASPESKEAEALDPAFERREARDAEFWRRRAKALEKDLAQAEHIAEQLAGLRDQPIYPPTWLMPESTPSSRAVLGLFLSDLHAGEVVDPDEILGLNAYNVDVFRKRIRRYFAAALEIGPRWASDCRLEGALVVLGGDLISGDIHLELQISNELTAHEQVALVVEEVEAGLHKCIEAFGRVHVVSVPGNHGRTTHKPTAKLYSRMSYDTLAASILRDRLEPRYSNITFQIPRGRDAVVPVLGWNIFVNHGDGLGSGGGQGFIGPLAPIVRGSKKVENQQFRAKRPFDLLLHGHYHTSANPGPVLSNGSVPGYTEYGNGLRAALEPPQQWLFLIHERWGLRERAEIKLEDPVPPPLPRVRIPATMGERI